MLSYSICIIPDCTFYMLVYKFFDVWQECEARIKLIQSRRCKTFFHRPLRIMLQKLWTHRDSKCQRNWHILIKKYKPILFIRKCFPEFVRFHGFDVLIFLDFEMNLDWYKSSDILKSILIWIFRGIFFVTKTYGIIN